MTGAPGTASRIGLAALVALTVAGCAGPRGAGFESEVLAAADGVAADGAQVPADFAVEPVTRAALPLYDGWPLTGEPSLSWIARQPESPNRVIAAGDSLEVTIWDPEENSLLTSPGQRAMSMDAITVSSGGSVFMPYIGNVRVAGMSPEHAREALEARFMEVAPSAQVQLELTEGRASTVSLVGGVNRPGGYPMPDRSYTVLSLIADGGGVNTALNNPQIRLMRGEAVFGTSIDRLFEEPGLDATLRGGDRVIVEADERYFLSLGATGREDRHDFPGDRLTAIEALSIMGGLSESRANPQGILVLRDYPPQAVRADGAGPTHERVVFTLDLTSADGLFSAGAFRIHSGDLVYATESPVTSAQTILSLLGGALGVADRL